MEESLWDFTRVVITRLIVSLGVGQNGLKQWGGVTVAPWDLQKTCGDRLSCVFNSNTKSVCLMVRVSENFHIGPVLYNFKNAALSGHIVSWQQFHSAHKHRHIWIVWTGKPRPGARVPPCGTSQTWWDDQPTSMGCPSSASRRARSSPWGFHQTQQRWYGVWLSGSSCTSWSGCFCHFGFERQTLP